MTKSFEREVFTMTKWSSVCMLLCIVLLTAGFSVHATVIRKSKTSMYNPTTVAVDDYLYTISKNDSYLYITSTSQNFRNCRMPADPVKNHVSSGIQASAMGNGKIVIWGKMGSTYEEASSTVRTSYAIMIVDPWICTYETLPIINDFTPHHWPIFPASIIAYQDAFDVFLPSRANCFPCRFNLNGKIVDQENQLPIDSEVPSREFHIQAYQDNDGFSGYFYVYNFKNKTSIMRLLNSDFIVLKEVHVNHMIDVISVNFDTHPLIAVCYAKPGSLALPDGRSHAIICERLNSNLEPISSISLHAEHGMVMKPNLKISKFGHLFVSIAQSEIARSSRENRFVGVHLHQYDETGQLVDMIDFGEFSDWYFGLNSLFIDDQYCLTMTYKGKPSSRMTQLEVYTFKKE